jgi:hypothetical protein
MVKIVSTTAILAALTIVIASCSYHPFLPPGNIVNTESPATLHKYETALSGAYGLSVQILDYSLMSGWVRVKYGISDRLEAGLSLSGLYLTDSVTSFIKYSYFSGGSYASVKFALVPNYISLDGGIGFGFSDLGNYANSDIGFIAGIENPYVVPIVQANCYIGVPIYPQTYYLGEGPGQEPYTPALTYGFRFNGGVKLPVSAWVDDGNTTVSFTATAGLALVSDKSAHSQFLTFGCGAQYQLPRKH